jgi:transcriptional regulator with XRE-family HTH domain
MLWSLEKVGCAMSRPAGELRGPKESPAWRKHIGERFAYFRRVHGEDQIDVSVVLEVDRSQISHIEHGRQSLTFEKALVVCDHWGISLDEFVERQPEQQEEVDVGRFKSEAANLPRPAFLFLWEILRLLQNFWPPRPQSS